MGPARSARSILIAAALAVVGALAPLSLGPARRGPHVGGESVATGVVSASAALGCDTDGCGCDGHDTLDACCCAPATPFARGGPVLSRGCRGPTDDGRLAASSERRPLVALAPADLLPRPPRAAWTHRRPPPPDDRRGEPESPVPRVVTVTRAAA